MPRGGERTGAETRTAILDVAAREFRAVGYEKARLGDIAKTLGITRSAVLHHFASKEAMLREVVKPYIVAIDELLARRMTAGSMTARKRRLFLTELVDVLCDHRDVAAIVAHDVSANVHLGPELQLSDRIGKFADVVALTIDDPHSVVRAMASVGAIIRPVYAPDALVDLSTPESRKVLVDAAMAVLSTGPRQ